MTVSTQKRLEDLSRRLNSSKTPNTPTNTRLAKTLSSSAFSQTSGSSFSNAGSVLAPTVDLAAIEASPASWRKALFPDTFTADLAPYHDEYWEWLWGVGPIGTGPDGASCFAAVWWRGGAKSTNVECGCVALAGHSKRRYGWYIGGTQSQADDHLATVSQRFLSPGVAKYYPHLAAAKTQMVGERSRQMGWRRRRIWTEDGFVIDALGLDAAYRGAKIEDQRPDFMIFDDVDGELDSEETMERKIATLTRKILPAASLSGCIYLVAQNLVHPNGIVTRLVNNTATYLGNRTVSGPHPAIAGLEYEGTGTEAVITAGVSTWPAVPLATHQATIKDIGIGSFLAECQHEITYFGAPRYDRELLSYLLTQCTDPVPAKLLPEWARDPFLEVWHLPVAGVGYVAYFDGATGVGGDYCVTVIMRADNRQMVAMLRDNKREQKQHAKVAAELIRQYNNALVGWERSHEAGFASVMALEGITRIYKHKEEQTTAQRINGTPPMEHEGYPARQKERRALVAGVANYINDHGGIIPSRVVVNELMSFIRTADQPDGEAAPSAHDDAHFGFGGALILCEQPGAQSVRGGERKPVTMAYGF